MWAGGNASLVASTSIAEAAGLKCVRKYRDSRETFFPVTQVLPRKTYQADGLFGFKLGDVGSSSGVEMYGLQNLRDKSCFSNVSTCLKCKRFF